MSCKKCRNGSSRLIEWYFWGGPLCQLKDVFVAPFSRYSKPTIQAEEGCRALCETDAEEQARQREASDPVPEQMSQPNELRPAR